MKDNFSTNSNLYKQFRPNYPATLFDFVFEQLSSFDCAWDCACGNGQIAQHLVSKFKRIEATDISQKQLDNAFQNSNIHYTVQAAEQTNFPANYFDLIIIGQAIHWFDFESFYNEVRRTAKKDALLVVVGYGKIEIDSTIDPIVEQLYSTILGDYWDKERRYIDEHYQTIPFPFKELDCPTFENTYEWTLEHLLGYLQTWSALKHYQQQNNKNPLELIKKDLESQWKIGELKQVNFPLLLRIGQIKTN